MMHEAPEGMLSRRGQALLGAAGQVLPEPRWYVLLVGGGREKIVDNKLAISRVEHWMPTETVKRPRRSRNGSARTESVRPLFKGYMLVNVVWTPMLWHEKLKVIDGVIGAYGGMEHPLTVRRKEFEEVQAYCDLSPKERRKLLALWRREAAGIAIGDKVSVTVGPMEGQKGVVIKDDDGGTKFIIDMMIFGRVVPTSIPIANLTKAA